MPFVLKVPVLIPKGEQDRWDSGVGLRARDSRVEGACDFAWMQLDGVASQPRAGTILPYL